MSRIEDLEKMANNLSFSPKMRKLYQQQADKERTEQKKVSTVDNARHELIVKTIQSCDQREVDRLAEEEYDQDYVIDVLKDSVRVTSLVAHSGHEGSYDFDTFARAQSKKVWLMRQRLYNDHVRTGEVDRLADLA